MLDDQEDSAPTDGQKQAGNYQKGHVWAHGMRISIENPAGSIRTGKGADGTEWASRMQHDYGYVRGSTGRDGDHIDVFLGPDFKNRDLPVHVVDQHDPETGKFDEHKAMMGFATQKDAVEAYHANYPHDWKGAQAVTPLHVDEFKRWATSPGARHKPLATHLGVKKFAGGGSVGSSEADEPTLGGFLSDPQSWKDMARNAGALGNRLATQIAGGPADLAMLPAHVLRGLNNIGRAAVGAEPMAELPEPAMGSAHFQRLAKDYLGAPTSTGDDAADALFDVSSMVAGLNPGKTARIVKAPARALRQFAEAPGPAAGGPAAQRGAVKLPGGNWAPNNVENVLRGLNVHVRTPGVNGHTEMNAAQDEALNGWVNKQLGRYIRTDLATERDPMLSVLDNGGAIHINPEDNATVRVNQMAGISRREANMPREDSGKTWPANTWSRLADAAVDPYTVQAILSEHEAYQTKWPDANAEAQHAWMRKADPNTQVNALSRQYFDNLEFDHLKDELRNALDPNSGLPRELQLTPQQLSRVSVPQAAELVGKINKWRAEQKVLADAARANNAATVTHMELPGGMRWVELKQPKVDLSDIRFEPTTDGVRAFDSQGTRITGPHGYNVFASQDDAIRQISSGRARQTLEDALRYEGDTMGHCVGGYCDDVAGGRSRIFSLRDAKGLPHATIEMVPPSHDNILNNLSSSQYQKVSEVVGRDPYLENPEVVLKVVSQLYPQTIGSTQPNIVQIKGKGNKGVAPKYQQHVLDFLHNTPHSTAEDLQLNGVHDVSADAGAAAYHSVHPGDKVPNDYNHVLFDHAQRNNLRYMTTQQIRRALGLQDFTDIKYAHGGRVQHFDDGGSAGEGGGYDAGPWWDRATYGTPAPQVPAHLVMTQDQFNATVKPSMLDAEGKFKGPDAGVNFALEGMTPEQVYASAQNMINVGDWSEDNRLGKVNSADQANQLLDVSWRPGPDNGGGFFGGLARAVGNLATGIAHNPAMMAALTAGVVNPAVNAGLRGAGMSASAAATATPLVTGAAKTVLNGGSLLDAAKGAGIGYISGVAGQTAADSLNLPELSPAVKYLVGTTTNSTLHGKPVKLDPFGFARSLASEPPKKG